MEKIAPHLLDEAARWHARLAAPDCTEFDRAGYRRWRSENDVHAKADAVAARVSANMAQLTASDSRLAALAEQALESGTGTAAHRPRWHIPAAIAASVAIAVLVVRGFALHAWLPEPKPLTFSTGAREQSSVMLDDGSKVRVDIASDLALRITRTQRAIDLKKGRALFDVAKDAARPFTVRAGNGTVLALGTRFQVQHDSNRVTVTLADGAVLVSQAVAGIAHEERLQPGDQLVYATDGTYWARRKVDSDSTISWSSGRLIFRGVPIEEALAEINRYTSRKIQLGDASLKSLEVSGRFAIGDSTSVSKALTQVLSLQADEEQDGRIVLRSNLRP